MSKFVLDGFLPYQLSVLAAQISREFSALYKSRFGITRPEWRVIAHLSQTDSPVSVREIFDRVDMDKSKVSRAASRLEASGHILKSVNPADRRLVELRLTCKGRAMVEELEPLARQFEKEVLQRLGRDAEQFRANLAVLLGKT